VTLPPPGRTRYARVSAPDVWVQARVEGFVSAILDAVDDGTDRVLLAWPSRPDSGLVAAAVALREARSNGRLSHATFGFWPWRMGAVHPARSILVHPTDVASAGARTITELRRHATWADPRLAHESLSMLEMRLNDLARPGDKQFEGRPTRSEPPDPPAANLARNALIVRSPTLLETTIVFAPTREAACPVYTTSQEQVLKRVRQHTHINDRGSTMDSHVSAVGHPERAPFAIFGFEPTDPRGNERCLAFRRFADHGLDAVVIDLTWKSRAAIGLEWESQLESLIPTLAGAPADRVPPVVILCEDAAVLRRAESLLREGRRASCSGRRPPLRLGSLLLNPGILESSRPNLPREVLPNIAVEADIKDASLVPMRRRLVDLAYRLRDAGRGSEALAVRSGLRALRRFASLPVGLAEAQSTAAILFDGDGREEIEIRARFFATAALQPLADAQLSAPEFATEIRESLADLRERVANWKNTTPVSQKLGHLLALGEWNREDVLLVLPDGATADIFRVSDAGVRCKSVVVDVSMFTEHLRTHPWRRIILVRPEPRSVNMLIAMESNPERVLLLGESAGAGLLQADLRTLASLPEFTPFAGRISDLLTALDEGGANESLDVSEAEITYQVADTETVVDFTQTQDGYRGEAIRLHLEGGGQLVYRPGGDVLLFTADEVRPFKRKSARNVQVGDSILALRKDVRDRLSDALARARKTVVQLGHYHSAVAQARERLPGATLRDKARGVLASMRLIDSAFGDHEVSNIARWLSVEPSESSARPQAPQNRKRFSMFMEALGIEPTLAGAYWDFAVLPSRTYSLREGHRFNKRIVQFVLDPEGVGAHAPERDDLWQAIVESVEVVTETEALRA